MKYMTMESWKLGHILEHSWSSSSVCLGLLLWRGGFGTEDTRVWGLDWSNRVCLDVSLIL